MGHILEVIDAAGDEGARPEAGDNKPTHNKPGKETHLGLGVGGDILLAVRALNLGRKGVEERHGVDNHWLLNQHLAWRCLHVLSRWNSTARLGILHLSFLDSHPPNFVSKRMFMLHSESSKVFRQDLCPSKMEVETGAQTLSLKLKWRPKCSEF